MACVSDQKHSLINHPSTSTSISDFSDLCEIVDRSSVSMKPLSPLRLRCSVQNYDWGQIGEESHVATLFSRNCLEPIDAGKPYAELWMGTHASGPSFVVDSGIHDETGTTVSLKSWIRENPKALGEKVLAKWGSDLPFLFKVLSVAKALSIQAHPDKELARHLHKSHPSIYKDPNHKPEMALAVTEFEALCGFVSFEELKSVLTTVPEIVELVGSTAEQFLKIEEQDGEEEVKSALKLIFTQLMSTSKDAVSEVVNKMKSRLDMENKMRALTDKEKLALRLEKQYPADVGVLAAFFLNYVHLEPGEALYLDANEPHAYIYGNCVECMATSDNVVRAGLTQKYRDVKTLCSMLTYKQGFPEILHGVPVNEYARRYSPPFDEFEVDQYTLPSAASVEFPVTPGPSIFIVASGEGLMRTSTTEEMIAQGDVFFIPAGTEITIKAPFTGLLLYRAGVNSKFLI
ncbi:mannose-6-phosphate isomerase 1-like [Aristolochia californica]|uniref:mannose-6-phosphate isomerase 1-like n=1 Tax=Aristolochia californica TaxID=171875 RepID=UPI0035D9DF6B